MKPLSLAFLFALGAVLTANAAQPDRRPYPVPISKAQPAGSGLQSGLDLRSEVLRAMCKQPPPRPQIPAALLARATAPDVGPFPYSIKAIPGVVDADVKWKLIWVQTGNNTDGMVGLPDGSVLIAQNDNSEVVRLTPEGHATVAYKDTNTGGSLALNKKGELFIAERSLIPSIWQLAPERKLIANSYKGEALECQGSGVMDSAAALHNGGVYFAWTGYYYASPDGKVTKVFDQPVNGATLSPDETRLYMGSGGNLYVGDVGADGMLSNTRMLAQIPGGGNDGATVDSQGRIYITGDAGVRVFEPDGKYLGTIPAPRRLVDVVFGGPGKKTLFAIGPHQVNPGAPDSQVIDEVYILPMLAQGYLERGK